MRIFFIRIGRNAWRKDKIFDFFLLFVVVALTLEHVNCSLSTGSCVLNFENFTYDFCSHIELKLL